MDSVAMLVFLHYCVRLVPPDTKLVELFKFYM